MTLLNPLQVSVRKNKMDLYSITELILNKTNVKPRLNRTREYFKVLFREDIDELISVFSAWRDHPEYLILRGDNISGETKFVGVKCSKRGNDVFARRLDCKLGFLRDDVEFFNPNDFERHANFKVKTRLLWITLTNDSKRCSLDESWERLGSEFNLWITNLRNKYGKISYCFFPQAFPDPAGEAYCRSHLHGIVYFEDSEFEVFRNMETDREGKTGLVFRIKEKDEVHSQGKWHSFIDVKALSSMSAVWNYAKKHCFNAGYGSSDEATLNNAVMWIKRKKSFNVSFSFRKKLSDYLEFITTLRSSKSFDVVLFGGGRVSEWKWSLLGVFDVFELGMWGSGAHPPWSVVLFGEVVSGLLVERDK